jgi:hypothetical protein
MVVSACANLARGNIVTCAPRDRVVPGNSGSELVPRVQTPLPGPDSAPQIGFAVRGPLLVEGIARS